jgi:hypothetical protein
VLPRLVVISITHSHPLFHKWGTEELCVMFIPATAPSIPCNALVTGSCVRRSLDTDAIASLTSERFYVPWATTIGNWYWKVAYTACYSFHIPYILCFGCVKYLEDVSFCLRNSKKGNFRTSFCWNVESRGQAVNMA